MSRILVNPEFVEQLKEYGHVNVNDCFNCGNCTAVCPLSEGETAFPRKMVRLAQIGAAKELAARPELWICHYCGECSDTCPRQADPGEFMAAARRKAIADYEPTGLASLMFRNSWVAVLVTVVLAAVLGAFLVSLHPEESPPWLFSLVAYETIHIVGVGALLGFVILGAIAFTRYFTRMIAVYGGWKKLTSPSTRVWQATKMLIQDILTMPLHGKCETDRDPPRPWTSQPRWSHWAIMWGFFLLLAATTLDFLLIYLAGTNFYLPARLSGTVGGALMLWGVIATIRERARAAQEPYQKSVLADWWLLIMLLLLTVTGFWLEIAVTFHWKQAFNDWALLFHTAVAMEFILLTPMTKFAHALYRPAALWVYHLKQAEGTANGTA